MTARRSPGQLAFWPELETDTMTRYTRPFCYSCRRTMSDAARHLSTASHRRTVARNARETTGPAGGHAHSARKAGAARAYAALRDYDAQYAEDDPGNSPEWDAAQAAGAVQ